jgi:hypothetical protein
MIMKLRPILRYLWLGALAALFAAPVSAQTPTAPSITTPPAPVTVATGANAVFTVVATGTAPLAYQWFKGETEIPAATAATLTLTAVTAADAASYKVRVTNTVNSVTSAAVALTVNAPAAGAPVITTQPVSQSVAAGAALTLNVTATGTGPLAYLWYKEARLISSGPTAALAIVAATAADAGTYRVVVSNASGGAVSNPAVVTVTGTPPPSAPPAVSPPVVSGIAPTITTPPASLAVASGAPATFSVVAAGTAPLRYRWYKNGREIRDAEAATFSLSAARLDDAAVYTVRVSNSAGQVTSAPAGLTVNGTVTIGTAPASQSVKAGANVTFEVAAPGAGLTYQWKYNGRTIKGATSATLSVPNVGALASGVYSVTVGNTSGAVAASAAALTVTTDARLVNIATRGHVGDDDEVLISGFVTRGTGQKKVLVRAVGPTLGAAFNVGGALANPRITLLRASRGNAAIGTNAGWGGTAELTAAFAQVGAFPLPPASADAALLATLENGGYTASVSAPRGSQGVALLEVYDAETGSPTAEITNISTRALVGAEAANVLIAGFSISGTTSDTVLIRGVGPSLGTLFGLRRALGASRVAVYDSKGNEVASNTVWSKGGRGEDDDDDDDDKSDDLDDASERAGAWKLPRGSTDSALLLTLAPGNYTVHVTGVRNSSGIALVEIFEVR